MSVPPHAMDESASAYSEPLAANSSTLDSIPTVCALESLSPMVNSSHASSPNCATSNLPLDILEGILGSVPSLSDLYNLCLCNKAFDTIGRRYLYRHILLGHHHAARVLPLYALLGSRPDLAQYVWTLNIDLVTLHHARDARAAAMFPALADKSQPALYPALIRLITRTLRCLYLLNHLQVECMMETQMLLDNIPSCSFVLRNLKLTICLAPTLESPVIRILQSQAEIEHLHAVVYPITLDYVPVLPPDTKSLRGYLPKLRQIIGEPPLHILAPGRPVQMFHTIEGRPNMDAPDVVLRNLSLSTTPLRSLSFTEHSFTLDLLQLVHSYVPCLHDLRITTRTMESFPELVSAFTREEDSPSLPSFQHLHHLHIAFPVCPNDSDTVHALRIFATRLFRSSPLLEEVVLGKRTAPLIFFPPYGFQHIFKRQNCLAELSSGKEGDKTENLVHDREPTLLYAHGNTFD